YIAPPPPVSDTLSLHDALPISLDPKSWPHADAAQKVLNALAAAGGEGRFVGGCVRDAILGRPIRDIDIATNLPPVKVIDALTAADRKSTRLNSSHVKISYAVFC